jgi:hypothetical protein
VINSLPGKGMVTASLIEQCPVRGELFAQHRARDLRSVRAVKSIN